MLPAEEKVNDLVVKREQVKKLLDQTGYHKWKKAVLLLQDQLIKQKQLEMKALSLKLQIDRVKDEYRALREEQSKELEELALADDPGLDEKVAEYNLSNGELEKGISDLNDQLLGRSKLLEQQESLIETLVDAEKRWKKEVDLNRQAVDRLVKQWMSLNQQIKKADAERE